MGLQRYREKRDFTLTREPKGTRPSGAGFSYVIQKHDASHLHYDFRLELDGVLLSWAVPKGPSLDPTVRRLAMQVEDHPIEYGSFEGTIPKSEYGGGTVMVWDRGTWSPLDDPKKGYAKGHLRFELHGAKLRGAWHLVRTSKKDDAKKSWLLFKSHDSKANTDDALLDEQPNSAETGRSMEEIAGATDSVWHSNRAAKRSGIAAKPTATRSDRAAKLRSLLQRVKRGALPKKVEPELPTLSKRVPTGPEWGYEIGYDGVRLLARIEEGAVELLGDRGSDWGKRLPQLARNLAKMSWKDALLDGTIAAQRPNGTTDASLLEKALREKAEDETTFFVFDLLHLDGHDLRKVPLAERKAILELALASNADPRIRYSPHFVSDGKAFVDAACKLDVASVVAKRLDRPYRSGQGRDWLKIACADKKNERRPKPIAAPLGVRLTHPERVLYPRDGITKQELAEYYAAVGSWMVPHVANRPLTLVRCPQGVGKQTFFQKHAKPPLPKSIRAIPIDDDGTPAHYMAVDDLAGILELVQMSVLEIHTWGAHADDPEKPDFLVFDLDPDPAVKWEAVIDCARLLRKGLEQLGLESYVKTTGGKGLHVCAPMERRISWDDAKEFTRELTHVVVGSNPKLYTATMSKAQRRGKIFIDFFRNGRGATFIAPYSTRARDGAAVAMPLAWDELSPRLRADHFNVRNVMQRMAKLRADPWKDASSKRQVLSAATVRSMLGRTTRRNAAGMPFA